MIQKILCDDSSVMKDKNVAVVFSAEWCDACHKLLAHLEPMSTVYDGKLYNADVDENENLASKCGVKSLPCTIVFKDGEQVQRFENNYSFQDLIEALRSL